MTPPNAPNGRSGIRVRCLVVLTLVGIASVGPAPVGAQSEGDAGAATRGVVLGAYSGAALGLIGGLSPCNRTIRGTTAALGAALGASPVGSGIGFGVGVTAGSLLWLVAPGVGLPEAAAISLAGLTIGGLLDWVHGAATAGGGPGPVMIPFQVRF